MCNEEEEDMNLIAEKYDVKKALIESMREVSEIQKGNQPKVSWRQSMSKLRDELDQEK